MDRNACIVGWAHTAFGRLDGETVESLIVRVATDALAMPGSAQRRRRDRAGTFQRWFLGAGLYRIAGAAGVTRSALQARDAGRECLRHRLRRRASGLRAIAAKSARIVLVVGVEQMTSTPAPEIGRTCSKPRTCARKPKPRAALPAFSATSPRCISNARATSPTRSRASLQRTTRMASAIHSRRCAATSATNSAGERGQEPLRRRSAQAHRLFTGVGWRCRAGAGRRGHRVARLARRSRFAPPPTCRISCRWRGATF